MQCVNTQHTAWLIVRTEVGKSTAHGDTDEGQQLTAILDAMGIQKGFPEKLTSTLRLEGGVETDRGEWGEEGSFTEEAPLLAENCW